MNRTAKRTPRPTNRGPDFCQPMRWLLPILAIALALLAFAGPVAGTDNLKEATLAELLADDIKAWNKDGVRSVPLGKIDTAAFHDAWFEENPYEGTDSCLLCHRLEGLDMLNSAHFKWEGEVSNIVGLEGEVHGKNDLLNNFCIAVPTNEGRCAQCHAGYGYGDKDFDFNNPSNVDCLICHDQTGSYKKGKTSAGMPDPTVDLNEVARNIAMNGGVPTRKACIDCHARAGGGDNVKHGDLSTDLIATTREFDVHMGTDGGDMACVECHGPKFDEQTGWYVHGMAGMEFHSSDEGEMVQCVDCHGDQMAVHEGTPAERLLFEAGWHDRLACQTCHIPAIARAISTKTEWYWSEAGQDIDPIPMDDTVTPTRPLYDKKKGTFVWANNVRPVLRFWNGTWTRKVLGADDTFDPEAGPVSLGEPLGSFYDPDAMIYPFKEMIGNQVVDSNDNRLMVPHLFGMRTGPNPYWGAFDWHRAVEDGAVYTGQEYSGGFGFMDTTMLLTVNHEIAPAEEALGHSVYACLDCHLPDQIDWQALGWTANPVSGGTRVPPPED